MSAEADAQVRADLRATISRVRDLVADTEETMARLVELASRENHEPTRSILQAAASDVRGQLAVDRRWLADLERRGKAYEH